MKENIPKGDGDEFEICNTQLSPFFIANNSALDFLNSIVVSGQTVVERLASGEDLLAWLVQAKLIDPGQSDAIRASSFPGELDEVAAEVRALREWFRGFVLNHMGRRLTAKALDLLRPLNRVLERDEKYWAIVARSGHAKNRRRDSGLERRALRRCSRAEALVLPIAQAMADLVCLEDFSKVKIREIRGVPLLVLDRMDERGWGRCNRSAYGKNVKQTADR